MTQKTLISSVNAVIVKWAALPRETQIRLALLAGICLFAFVNPAFAQSNPWEDAVNSLRDSFKGPIARGLSLIAIVVGGLMFAFGEGGSKKMPSGIIFGLGMALGAVNFMDWLFPGNGN